MAQEIKGKILITQEQILKKSRGTGKTDYRGLQR